MTTNQNTCAFTGHRPKSFPWKYNEAARECVLLKEALSAQITAWGWTFGAHRSSLACKRSILQYGSTVSCLAKGKKLNGQIQRRSSIVAS